MTEEKEKQVSASIKQEREEIRAEEHATLKALLSRAQLRANWSYSPNWQVLCLAPKCQSKGQFCLPSDNHHASFYLCEACFGSLMQHLKDPQFLSLLTHEPGYCSALNRAADPDNWVEEEAKEGHNEVLCDNTEQCWYGANLDRLGEYISSFRFKGTRIYMCDKCMQIGISAQIEELLCPSHSS